jgi:YggT family protein
MGLVARIIDAYTIILFVTVLLSWFPVPEHHPAVRFLRSITEPLLAPLRRMLPSAGGLDFSPLVLMLLLQLLRGAIIR